MNQGSNVVAIAESNTMPTTSVVITTHNRPHSLPRAVESAWAAGADVEVVVVDDASNDETARVCRGLSGIRYVRVERNQQVAGARNIGILNSTGEFIAFLDDDDVRLAGSLDLQTDALRSAPDAGLIYGQALINDPQLVGAKKSYPRRCPQGDVFWELLEQNFIPCGAVVFRRSCLFRVGLLDHSVPGIDDWDLWIRIAAFFHVIALEQPVVVWRKSSPSSGQGTSRADQLVKTSTRHLQHKWFKLQPAVDAQARKRQVVWRQFSENMACHLAVETIRAVKAGDLSCAPKNAVAALHLHPWSSVRSALNFSLRSRTSKMGSQG